MKRLLAAALRFLRDISGAEQENPAAELRRSVQQMNQSLEHEADAASFAMALADEKYDELKREVANVALFESQAREMVTGGNDQLARRAIFLKQKAEQRVAELSEAYKQMQAQAEARAQSYAKNRNEIERRAAEAPELQREIQLQDKHRKVLQAASGQSFEQAAGAFDAAKQGVKLGSAQSANRARLSMDPNAAIDREIRETLARTAVERELQEMKERIPSGTVLPIAPPKPDAIDEAQRLLSAPRWQSAMIGRQLG